MMVQLDGTAVVVANPAIGGDFNASLNILQWVMTGYLLVHAGAAYVPIDPDHPPQRISRVLAQARPAAVVTASGEPPAGLALSCPVVSVADALLAASSPAVRS
ncbi:hypothetical protein MOQ72_20245 [Saccharopolyspora sp. K220]|uniref:hypothetical protein n=1 Tax=Saccharopolyspora soli TaxID=2926618 RepID=UPI001F59EA80|nr:hypothetical protein [Saccharopolyspora soli]MCI2419782.1 hypothetical protein [Saccharopolyspora soli]